MRYARLTAPGSLGHRCLPAIAWIALTALVAACGGGGSGGQTSAPSGLTYPFPGSAELVVDFAMTPLTPTVTGQVTSWAANPALPPGITLNSTTGVISGTPTAASSTTSYTITAANAGGSTSTAITLSVSTASIAYPSSIYVFAPGAVAQTLRPNSNVGITFTNWSSTPALPAGLTLDPATGYITGAATSAAAAANYTITASNPQGHVSTTLSIAVTGSTLLDLGLGGTVTRVRYVNSSVLSEDNSGYWVLQDYTSGQILAEGSGADKPYVDLQGNVMIDEAAAGLEVRSPSTGQVLATITPPAQVSWYRLATDGSYIVAGSPTALTVWSTSGVQLFSVAGNYAQTVLQGSQTVTGAEPFAAPGQVQIANGPAGANVIQTITVPGGVAAVSPAFQGAFYGWFPDGQRFFSTQGTTVWTYSSGAVQQDITSLNTIAGLAGSGNWFWTFDGTEALNVYKVGASTTPALTIPAAASTVASSGNTLALLNSGPNYQGITVYDLSGATLTSTSYPNIPFTNNPVNVFTGYAAQSPTQWLVGNQYGVVVDGASLGGTPRSLTFGSALSIAAGTKYISVATASGRIVFFNASSGSLTGTISFPSSLLSASADGTVLAAAADWQLTPSPSSTLNVYSIPSGIVINSFSYTAPSTALTYVGLSGSGTVAAEMFQSPTTACLTQVIAVAGGPVIVCDNSTSDVNVQLSPDGTLAATSSAPSTVVSSKIYQNGTLVTAVPGYAVGWLDNNHLLLNNYTEPGQFLQGNGLTIYDASGKQVGTSPVVTIDGLQLAPGASNVYDIRANSIVSLASGATIWAGGNISSNETGGMPAALTGSDVVFVSGNHVLAVPY